MLRFVLVFVTLCILSVSSQFYGGMMGMGMGRPPPPPPPPRPYGGMYGGMSGMYGGGMYGMYGIAIQMLRQVVALLLISVLAVSAQFYDDMGFGGMGMMPPPPKPHHHHHHHRPYYYGGMGMYNPMYGWGMMGRRK
ncbi:unnamed protein product [Nippostrongylus brasiliensis]|uniref:Uncharacterized protein n=1 Tax=Nippostrongylus brasiliensis TaxID=27835 RepID=A0A0N4YB49_NIPBR|nr:unnamed protein product [Nippostrongylus brasiliensis]